MIYRNITVVGTIILLKFMRPAFEISDSGVVLSISVYNPRFHKRHGRSIKQVPRIRNSPDNFFGSQWCIFHASDEDRINHLNWWEKVASKLTDKDYRLRFNLVTEFLQVDCKKHKELQQTEQIITSGCQR